MEIETLTILWLVMIGFSLSWSAISLKTFYEKAKPGEHEDENFFKSYCRGDCWLMIIGLTGLFHSVFSPEKGTVVYLVVLMLIFFFAPFVRTVLGMFMGWIYELKNHE